MDFIVFCISITDESIPVPPGTGVMLLATLQQSVRSTLPSMSSVRDGFKHRFVPPVAVAEYVGPMSMTVH